MNIKLTTEFLHQLVDSTNSRKAIIFSNIGLSMFSTLNDNKRDENISAHSATMYDHCESSIKQMEALSLKQLIIENENGYMFIVPANETSYLILFTNSNPDLAFIKSKMQETISLAIKTNDKLELV